MFVRIALVFQPAAYASTELILVSQAALVADRTWQNISKKTVGHKTSPSTGNKSSCMAAVRKNTELQRASLSNQNSLSDKEPQRGRGPATGLEGDRKSKSLEEQGQKSESTLVVVPSSLAFKSSAILPTDAPSPRKCFSSL